MKNPFFTSKPAIPEIIQKKFFSLFNELEMTEESQKHRDDIHIIVYLATNLNPLPATVYISIAHFLENAQQRRGHDE